MAVDLHNRAATQRDALAVVVSQVGDALAAARSDLTRRHPDPDSVEPADFTTGLGAAQHVDVARSRLAATKQEENAIRAALAAITNPADAQTFEDDLRDNLIKQAELRVEVRSGSERKASSEDLVARLSTLTADAGGSLQVAEDAVLWGKERQDHTSTLTDLLNQEPLSTATGTATTVLGSPEFDAAQQRLDDLLPAALLARAEARFGEAQAAATDAAQHATVGDQAIDGLNSTDHPQTADVDITRRAYRVAEDALTRYVQSTGGRLGEAPSVLASVAELPDLLPAQSAALNPVDPTDFETAIGRESDLVNALAQLAAARRALDDANLGVLMGDPAADPATAEADLQSVETTIVAPARAAYDAATQATLDQWEVEVPPKLWLAVRDFIAIRTDLTTIADPDHVTDLIAALDSAEDKLGEALDKQDASIRQRLSVRLNQAHRQSQSAGVRSTVSDRLIHYVRGDGPSGRTTGEL